MKSKEINEQINYGLDSLDPNRTIEIKVKDFMLIYKTFQEFIRYFHQPMHYPTLEDIKIFLGNTDSGAFSIMSKIYYHMLDKYIPKDIEEKFGEQGDPFHNPEYPYYYKVKSDESIDDGTIEVKDRASFVNYVNHLLAQHKTGDEKWEHGTAEEFMEAIGRYADEIDGYYKNNAFDTSAETPTWRIFAQIVRGATIYE